MIMQNACGHDSTAQMKGQSGQNITQHPSIHFQVTADKESMLHKLCSHIDSHPEAIMHSKLINTVLMLLNLLCTFLTQFQILKPVPCKAFLLLDGLL